MSPNFQRDSHLARVEDSVFNGHQPPTPRKCAQQANALEPLTPGHGPVVTWRWKILGQQAQMLQMKDPTAPSHALRDSGSCDWRRMATCHPVISGKRRSHIPSSHCCEAPPQRGAPQDSPRVWGLPAEQPDPMQTLPTAGELHLPQRAGHHFVRHFTGLLHSPKYLQRQCLGQVRNCM